MTLYVSTHQAPPLAPEEVASYVPDLKAPGFAEFRNAFINLEEGFIVTVYEGESADAVRQEFDRIGWPVDSTHEVQYAMDKAALDAIPS